MKPLQLLEIVTFAILGTLALATPLRPQTTPQPISSVDVTGLINLSNDFFRSGARTV